MRQQAEVEVIDYISISKTKSRFHVDLIAVVMLLVLCCNILFPERGSNLILCVIRKFDLILNQKGSMGKIFFVNNWAYQILRVQVKLKSQLF